MAIALTRFSQWMLRADQKQQHRDKRSNLPLETRISSPPSRSSRGRIRKRRGTTSENNRIDREHDMVIVPSDGGACLSGSESDGSDWSIGWLEPHPHDFCTSDADSEDSFAVLVPCYRPLPTRASPPLEMPNAPFPFGVRVPIPIQEDPSLSENNEFLQHWLSSLASDPLV